MSRQNLQRQPSAVFTSDQDDDGDQNNDTNLMDIQFSTPEGKSQRQPQQPAKKKLTTRRITNDDEIEIIDFITGKKKTNVSINELSSVQLARREHGKYQSSFKVLNPDPITPSLMIKFYNQRFGTILERFKLDLSILDHNYARLDEFITLFRLALEFFKKNLINERFVNDIYVYNAKIIAVVPPNTSDLFRRIVHSLFVTHTETKLNALGHIFTNTDAVNIRNGIWCANLIRRTIVPT
ncbi:unnamed protein product [Rotaria sp. Silwood1]|nr:unnamed protein product [Rotaria sp. Silwood1]CAF3758610.1 unnamed protein product [Rotaria sp. Silwood1]CAF3810478.1 unnamed protein product [Rotaria sp. Silwood1]CAF3841688.1 unnamed protein product [Rotaria sp. Silwood1]CAF4728036.1 unnamed protein product [Rotaria sp. Silwood1]